MTPSEEQNQDDYDFRQHFGLISDIQNQNAYSKQQIADALISTLNEQDFRAIISIGINGYFNKTHKNDFIQQLDQSLQSVPTNNVSIDKDMNGKSATATNDINKIFGILSLFAKTCEYLDFKSYYQCRLVKKQWMYDSYAHSI